MINPSDTSSHGVSRTPPVETPVQPPKTSHGRTFEPGTGDHVRRALSTPAALLNKDGVGWSLSGYDRWVPGRAEEAEAAARSRAENAPKAQTDKTELLQKKDKLYAEVFQALKGDGIAGNPDAEKALIELFAVAKQLDKGDPFHRQETKKLVATLNLDIHKLGGDSRHTALENVRSALMRFMVASDRNESLSQNDTGMRDWLAAVLKPNGAGFYMPPS